MHILEKALTSPGKRTEPALLLQPSNARPLGYSMHGVTWSDAALCRELHRKEATSEVVSQPGVPSAVPLGTVSSLGLRVTSASPAFLGH